MVLEISSTLLARLLNEAAASPDAEVCGLLFGTDTRIEAAQACRNVAIDPARTFEIDPAQLIAAHRAARGGGATIVGCYHSHPGGLPLPSERDAAAAAPDGSFWMILGGSDVRCYRAVASGSYVGRFEAVEYGVKGNMDLSAVACGSKVKLPYL